MVADECKSDFTPQPLPKSAPLWGYKAMQAQSLNFLLLYVFHDNFTQHHLNPFRLQLNSISSSS